MASTIYNGKFLRFKFDDKHLIHATNCKLDVSSKLEEIATKDTDGTVSIPSGYSFSGSTEALLSNLPSGNATHCTADTLLDAQLAGTEIDIEFSTNITGDFIYTGKAFIENYSLGAETGTSVKVSISFKGNGNLTKEVVGGSIPPDTTPPTAPSDLTYDTNIIDPSNSALRKFTLHFTPSVESESSLVAYEIYINGGFSGIFSFAPGGNPTSVEVINLNPATEYFVKLRGKDIFNNVSDFSNEISVTTVS